MPATIPDPSTIRPLEEGQLHYGNIGFGVDSEWVAVTLEAGETYLMRVSPRTSSSISSIEDTVMRMYDSESREVAYNDDYGDDYLSAFRFTARETGTYYIQVAGYDDSERGRFTLRFEQTDPIEPLEALDWGTEVSDPEISVYFGQNGDLFDGYTSEGFNGYERARWGEVFDQIEAVTNLEFTVVDQAAGADFRLVMDLNEDTTGFSAYFNPPGEVNAGVGVFDGNSFDRTAGGSLRDGGEGFAILTHEVLHGLGLAHPHDDGGRSAQMEGVYYSYDDYGTANLNQGIFTTMSYNSGFNTGTPGSAGDPNHRWGYEIGPMALDIALLQEKYGVNTTTGTGDTVYTLPTANQGGTGWRAIWDVTGVDEIRADRIDTTGVTISLRAATLQQEIGGGGFYSGETGIAGGFTIANGVTIENATGAGGNDSLYGNVGNNTLVGLGGDDTLVGGGGSDYLQGSGGYDRAVLPFNIGDIAQVSESLGSILGRLYLRVEGVQDTHTVVLAGIDEVRFQDGSEFTIGEIAAMLSGEGLRVDGVGQIMGTAQDDTVVGGDGADLLNGLAGDDTMVGGLGNDFYIVDNPLDFVREDATFSEGGGIDTVRAFVDYVQPENVELVRLANIADVRHLDATGNDAPGTLVGNAGDNVINGRGGNDQINGNDGDDTLTGGVGRDTLVGGRGEDVFVYSSISESRAGADNRDVINGFSHFTRGSRDKIDLRGIDADTTSFGVDDAFDYISTDAFSGTAGELRTQSLGGPNAVLVEGDINGDGIADIQIFVNLTRYMREDDFLL